MIYKDSAFTVDIFLPMIIKNTRILSSFAWEIIHNLNGSSKTFPLIPNPNYIKIAEELRESPKDYTFYYRKSEYNNDLYIHSEFAVWNTIKFSYSKTGEYSYEVIFTN